MKIVEIFSSFQGEGFWTGHPMTFIRVAGCPVACPFCDTDYINGTPWSIEQIMDEVNNLGNQRVCITGGEPLATPNFDNLCAELASLGYTIHCETSGCYPRTPRAITEADIWFTVSPKGEWLGAKKNFLEDEWLEEAAELKILVPSTPDELIKRWLDKAAHYGVLISFQPENYATTVNLFNLKIAEEYSRSSGYPLSLQMHKFTNWR